MSDDDDKKNVVIPRWFLVVVGVVSSALTTFFIPWAVWTTATLLTVSIQVDNFSKVAESFDAVRAEQIRRTANVARVNEMRDTVKSLAKRLDSLETRLERLRGNK